MSTNWLSTIQEISNGQQVSASVVNAVTAQLLQRDEYLYETLQALTNQSILVASNLLINPTETGLTANIPFAVYYSNNLTTGQQGLIRARAAFNNSNYTSFYQPNNSCFTLGLIESLNNNGTANVYVSGLITLPYAINDPTYGILDYTSGTSQETFVPGPYFLSPTNPGRITASPKGLTVQVGYALTSTVFWLSPAVDQFSQLFANYQFDILSRPTGTPVNTGGVYTIPTSTVTRLGWVDVANLPGSYTVPTGAKFFYNIPSSYAVDNADNSGAGSLSTTEKTQATELAALLPPDPANFVSYFQAGQLIQYLTSIDTAGLYTINSYGIWWYSNTTVPWSTSLPSGWVPANWPTTTAKLWNYIIFAKLNPNIENIAVTSLAAYPDGTQNVLSLLSQSSNLPATTGSLNIKFNLPTSSTSATSAATAVSSLAFNTTTGALNQTTIPVVSTLTATPNSGLAVSTDGSGNYTIAVQGLGSSGPVNIQEIGSIYDFYGLNNFLRLPYTSISLATGFIGTINLPKQFPLNQNIKIYLNLFGTQALTSTQQSVAFTFEYVCNTAQNGTSPTSVKTINSTNTGALLSVTTSTTSVTLADIVLPTNYVAYTSNIYQPTQFVIPSTNIGPDTNIVFRVYRTQSTAYTPYNYDVGVLACYWSVL